MPDEILKKYWGFSSFRDPQEHIVRSVLEGKDTLGLMPTGGGKSLCYQVPAMCQEGICLVISPLIALMKDQVEALRAKGIRAAAVFSGMPPAEIDHIFDNCIYGPYKFLYLSPERLQTELALERIRRMKVNLIAVDEAHCISQWGHDFRPAYREIARLRTLLPGVPVLALTATATPRVEEDIRLQLRFGKDGATIRKSFYRANLAYLVLQEENKQDRLLRIFRRQAGSGIVYARNRRETERIAAFLRKQGISAAYYHAGMDLKSRDAAQRDWQKGKVRVIAATNAFGMGIDKPDVRLVVHMDLPESPEAYFQEAGRAGRDGAKSFAILLYSPSDKLRLLEQLEQRFPSPDEIRAVYQALGNYFQLPVGAGEGRSFDFDPGEFCRRYRFSARKVLGTFHFLEKDAFLSFSESIFLPSRLRLLADKESLYRFQVAHAEYDAVLKSILRSYGGVFDFYVPVDENLLARRAGREPGEYVEALKYLQRAGLISYFPRSDAPRITYLNPRADAKHLTIDASYLRARKEEETRHVQAMIAYAESKSECRSKMLLDYFGESGAGRCGICDFCIALNREQPGEAEFVQIRAQLTALLSGKALPLENVLDAMAAWPERKVLFVIRLLLDEGALRQGEPENALSLS